MVDDVVHSGEPNYKKMDFDSLKVIRNDSVSQQKKRGVIGI